MPRKAKGSDKQELLFPQLHEARYGESRKHQNLFLPKLLRKGSAEFLLPNESQERAYRIMSKWADLESSGKLQKRNETALEAEFLTEVFGEALGYTKFSENLSHWNLEPKFAVNSGQADAAIGMFEHGCRHSPAAVIELKGPTANLDRDRSNGRTAVQQCWDYLNEIPECPWGIVCNYVSFRLYHRNYTPRAYQLFVLQDLKREETFREFYYLFEQAGLLASRVGQTPRAQHLLERTGERQREVGDELYGSYDRNRREMILHLRKEPYSKPLEQAIHIAQKLLDRIIFVAFCEDRDLLPAKSIEMAYSQVAPFARVTNPRWQNFLNLFRSIDKGNESHGISAYNGGLFKKDTEVDDLDLDDRWTEFFGNIGRYDFRDEVNVDVLGRLFEKSVSDIGRIRLAGLFDEQLEDDQRPKMLKSAERKRFGIYYTPPEFTSFITFNVVGKLIEERFAEVARKMDIDSSENGHDSPDPARAAYWRACLEHLRDMKIVDPACGSGAFLISAYNLLEEKYLELVDHLVFHDGQKPDTLVGQIPRYILHDNLHGVDLSPEAVEITQLALWIRSAERGKSLADLSQNIVCGNSLVSDPEVHPSAMRWEDKFKDVFNRSNPGFDCVIGNPPWERVKLQEREFFDNIDSSIASAVNAATRQKLIDKLGKSNPEIYERYNQAKNHAEAALDYARKSGRFLLTGKGDINTYALFAELAYSIASENSRVGLLVPSGIATDDTTKDFFGALVDAKSLIAVFDFENKAPVFPDVHRSFKFSILLFGGKKGGFESADFAFFLRRVPDLQEKDRHIRLSANDIKLLNPNTHTCPIFRSNRDAQLTISIYRRVPVLVDYTRGDRGNPWGIKFLRMFDQTNDAELFTTAEQLKKARFKRAGSTWRKAKEICLPLYEAKMVQMYDHRAASVVTKGENWMRQGQTVATTLVQHQAPEYHVEPRWWVSTIPVSERLGPSGRTVLLGLKDITSPTNQRTVIAAAVPWSAVTNHFPIVLTSQQPRPALCLLSNLNSFVLDYAARQKIGGITLNFFIVEQLPVLPPDAYSSRCPWDHRQTLEKWISDRVLKLTCTGDDMIPLAEIAGFDPPIHKWNPDERADLMAQLDAAYFLLYGIKRADMEYILSTFTGLGPPDDSMFETTSKLDLILKYYDRFSSR